MVERLKAAIEKARQRRGAAPDQPQGPSEPPTAPDRALPSAWLGIEEATIDPAQLLRHRVVSHQRSDPAHLAFDILRTQLTRVCADAGWTKIGVTSPTKGCGKTMVVANLAFSLARHPSTRTIALDLDLRAPALARCVGLKARHPIAEFLSGRIAPDAFLDRVGDRLAFGLNTRREADSAELMQSRETVAALDGLSVALRPTLMLYDLQPMLVADDTLGMLQHLDAILLVAAAGQTTAAQVRECERLIDGATNLIGVALNKCEDAQIEGYQYGYEAA